MTIYEQSVLWDSIVLALWLFSPVLVLGGVWLVVSLGAKVISKLFDYPKYW